IGVRRRYRIALVSITTAACVAGFAGLAALSRGSQGPLSAALERMGTALGTLEHVARARVRGPERATALTWFAPYTKDAARLRRPDSVLLGAFDSGLPRTLDGIVRLERVLGTTFPLVQ